METVTIDAKIEINPLVGEQVLRAWNNLFEASESRQLSEKETELHDCLTTNIIECTKLIATFKKEK